MKITRVWLDESTDECTSCGLCESIAPNVFEVPDKMIVKENVDFDAFKSDTLDAADSCPVGVIKYEEVD